MSPKPSSYLNPFTSYDDFSDQPIKRLHFFKLLTSSILGTIMNMFSTNRGSSCPYLGRRKIASRVKSINKAPASFKPLSKFGKITTSLLHLSLWLCYPVWLYMRKLRGYCWEGGFEPNSLQCMRD